MKMISTHSALEAIYYLMAIDGSTDAEERARFDEIGFELDRKSFASYRDELAASCDLAICAAETGEERYDVIQEALDAALGKKIEPEDQGVTPRLLIWDLFAVAFSNGQYDDREKRLIAHVARIVKVDKSVVLDMEQLLHTAQAVQKELAWAEQSDRPYREIRPLVVELETRLSVILESAKALVEDEVVLDDPFIDEPDVIEKTISSIGEAVSPVAETVAAKTKETADSVIQAISPLAKKGAKTASGLFGKAKGLFSKNAETETPPADAEPTAEEVQ